MLENVKSFKNNFLIQEELKNNSARLSVKSKKISVREFWCENIRQTWIYNYLAAKIKDVRIEVKILIQSFWKIMKISSCEQKVWKSIYVVLKGNNIRETLSGSIFIKK